MANSLYYDDYDQFGIGDFDHIENATIIDLSVNSSTPYQDDKGTIQILSITLTIIYTVDITIKGT